MRIFRRFDCARDFFPLDPFRGVGGDRFGRTFFARAMCCCCCAEHIFFHTSHLQNYPITHTKGTKNTPHRPPLCTSGYNHLRETKVLQSIHTVRMHNAFTLSRTLSENIGCLYESSQFNVYSSHLSVFSHFFPDHCNSPSSRRTKTTAYVAMGRIGSKENRCLSAVSTMGYFVRTSLP